MLLPLRCPARPRPGAGCGGMKFLLAALLLSAGRSLASHRDHSYKEKELVSLYANKAGPFHNPRRA